MSNHKKINNDFSLSNPGSHSDPLLYANNTQKYSSKNLQEYKDYLNENFKVVVRVRPPLPREITGDQFVSTVFFSFKFQINPYENYYFYFK